MAGTADPSCPKGYSMPYAMLSNKTGEGILPRQSLLRHCLGMSLQVSSGNCLFHFFLQLLNGLFLDPQVFLFLPLQFSPPFLLWEGVRQELVGALLLSGANSSHCHQRRTNVSCLPFAGSAAEDETDFKSSLDFLSILHTLCDLQSPYKGR